MDHPGWAPGRLRRGVHGIDPRGHPGEQGNMSELSDIGPSSITRYLDNAYPRIVKLAVVLTVIGVAASIPLQDWRGTLVLAVGSAIGTLNLVWLHRGANLMVSRMLSAGAGRPSKLRVALFFPLRYILMIGAVY